MIRQLSVYMENKKGGTLEVLSLLSRSQINVLGLVSKDNTEFSTLRLILSDASAARRVLEEAGYLCNTSLVVGVELDDSPGALEAMLALIEHMNININYLYVGYARENGMPIIIVHCEYAQPVEEALNRAGYRTH